MEQERVLTHDEKKASEAAFRGLPFNPTWSESAQKVYDGILQVLATSKNEGLERLSHTESAQKEPVQTQPAPEPPQEEAEEQVREEAVPPADDSSPADDPEDVLTISMTADSLPLNSRKKSITAGMVKDATPAAKRIGLEIPVGLTNALWKNYVAISQDMSEDHIQSRLQDILVGVRLRLASLKEAIPFVDVPVLLDFPPEAIPQVNLAFALFHRDPEEGPCLLLIHPGEIFSPNQNISQN